MYILLKSVLSTLLFYQCGVGFSSSSYRSAALAIFNTLMVCCFSGCCPSTTCCQGAAPASRSGPQLSQHSDQSPNDSTVYAGRGSAAARSGKNCWLCLYPARQRLSMFNAWRVVYIMNGPARSNRLSLLLQEEKTCPSAASHGTMLPLPLQFRI